MHVTELTVTELRILALKLRGPYISMNTHMWLDKIAYGLHNESIEQSYFKR